MRWRTVCTYYINLFLSIAPFGPVGRQIPGNAIISHGSSDSVCAKRFITSHFPENLAVSSTFKPPSSAFYGPFIVLVCDYLINFSWCSAWLISIHLSYLHWSSSRHLQLSLHYVTLLTLAVPSHIPTSVSELLPDFPRATRAFRELNHETTNGPLLTNSPRKLCIILHKDLSSFGFWLT